MEQRMSKPTIAFIAAVAVLIAFIVLMSAALSQPQQTTIYDERGRVTGRAATDSQGSTVIYDDRGRITGRTSTDSQGTTTIYNSGGRAVGKIGGTK